MKQILLLFLSVSLLSCNQSVKQNVDKSVVFEQYFPLKKGETKIYYVSHLTGNDTLEDENDTSFCITAVVNKKEIFYFTDEPNDSVSIIGSQSFCDGIFYFENGIFFVSPIFWKADIEKANLDYFEPIFPKNIVIDSVYKYQNGEEKRKYIFNKVKNLSIKGKTVGDCLKLTVIQDWPTDRCVDTVWFKKDIGVVKWFRCTGRLEEIQQ